MVARPGMRGFIRRWRDQGRGHAAAYGSLRDLPIVDRRRREIVCWLETHESLGLAARQADLTHSNGGEPWRPNELRPPLALGSPRGPGLSEPEGTSGRRGIFAATARSFPRRGGLMAPASPSISI